MMPPSAASWHSSSRLHHFLSTNARLELTGNFSLSTVYSKGNLFELEKMVPVVQQPFAIDGKSEHVPSVAITG